MTIVYPRAMSNDARLTNLIADAIAQRPDLALLVRDAILDWVPRTSAPVTRALEPELERHIALIVSTWVDWTAVADRVMLDARGN